MSTQNLEPQKTSEIKEEPKELLSSPLPAGMEKINLGSLITEADKAKKDPESLKKRIEKRKKTTAKKEPDSSTIEEAADTLASAGEKIKVEKNGEVSINIDLSKIKNFEQVFQPDVTGFNLKIDEKTQRVAARKTIKGKIGYYYKENDQEIYLEVPETGKASITIAPDKLLKLSREEVISKMREEALKASKQKAKELSKKVAEESKNNDLAINKPKTYHEPHYESYSPSPRRQYSENIASSLLDESYNLPEKIKGPIKTKESTYSQNNSPTGMPLYLNTAEHPELKNKPPQYIVILPGDGNSIEETLNKFDVRKRATALRKAGINVVVVIPAHNPDNRVKRDDKWDYFKNSNAFDKMMEFAGSQAGASIDNINLISYSGGYRAVAQFLKSPTYAGKISSISMLDSTFADEDDPIIKELAEYINRSGTIRAVTSTLDEKLGRQTRNGIEKIKSLISPEMAEKFEVVNTNLPHRTSAMKYFWPNLKKSITELANETFNATEKFTPYNDVFGNLVKIREALAPRLQAVQNYLKNRGYNLWVESGYRNLEQQQNLWAERMEKEHANWSKRPANERNALIHKYGSAQKAIKSLGKKWCASPGGSPHHTGGAVDVFALPENYKNKSSCPKSIYREPPATQVLEEAMLNAGFVRYEAEFWHFEYGTERWAKKTRNKNTPLYAKYMNLPRNKEA